MIRIAIIDDQVERSSRLQEILLEKQYPETVRIFRYNSIDTFTTDAYQFSNLNFLIVNMSLKIGIPAKEGIFILKKTATLHDCQFVLLKDIEMKKNMPFNLIDAMIGAINVYVKKNRDRTLANRIWHIVLQKHKQQTIKPDTTIIPLHQSQPEMELVESNPFGQTEALLAAEILFNSTIDVSYLSDKFQLPDTKIISVLQSIKLKADHLHYSIQTMHLRKQS